MKKICAILLFSLFLFNLWGYYLLFISLRYRADRQLETRLDAGMYNSRETILLKTFLPLPYSPDSKDFERAQGEMVYQGLHYNVVKRRIFRDTLYTVYVRDPYKNRLYRKINEMVGLFTCAPAPSSRNAHAWDNLLKEYLPIIPLHSFQTEGFASQLFFPGIPGCLPCVAHTVLGPPPKSA
ncbi:MAG TPA: hypothetical protein VIU45_01360 [Chitinophagaceae bacterium]